MPICIECKQEKLLTLRSNSKCVECNDKAENEVEQKYFQAGWKSAVQRILWLNREKQVVQYSGDGTEPPGIEAAFASSRNELNNPS